MLGAKLFDPEENEKCWKVFEQGNVMIGSVFKGIF
jgi:hypothetical protein